MKLEPAFKEAMVGNLKIKEGFYRNDQLKFRTYLDAHDRPHREDGPADCWWFLDGRPMFEEYFIKGDRHREDGPAYRCWWSGGHLKEVRYYLEGELHRRGGPSLQRWDTTGRLSREEYWLNGEEVSRAEALSVEFPKVHIMPDTRPNKQSMLF